VGLDLEKLAKLAKQLKDLTLFLETLSVE